MTYYKCDCGCDEFIRIYNVWNERLKVQITEGYHDCFWKVEELGMEKDHLVGYICAKCRQDADELNDGL